MFLLERMRKIKEMLFEFAPVSKIGEVGTVNDLSVPIFPFYNELLESTP